MGVANRERRRMKAKARKRPRPGAPAPDRSRRETDDWVRRALSEPREPSLTEQAGAVLNEAARALDRGDRLSAGTCLDRLAGEGVSRRRPAERLLDQALRDAVTTAWQHGWQPVDVLRVINRRLKPAHEHVARAVIAAENSAHASATVDPRWTAQLTEAEVSEWWPAELSAVQACARSHPAGWADLVAHALEVLTLLGRLPRLEILMPVPGTAVPSRPRRAHEVDERVLARVRALLAKAESTPYAEEADTFTAGAQALMARHSIDHALLAATGRTAADEPTGRRIGIDNPYEAPKATLLDAVASANRSRVVWAKEWGFATVVGFPTDLDLIEILFTSLLVQAVAAMTREGSRTNSYGGSRTRTFRQSFLLSYAHRIRERLTEATQAATQTAAAETGDDRLLPVLASRDDEVQRATAAMFPHLVTHSAGHAWDGEGWARGRAAAELATLTPAASVES